MIIQIGHKYACTLTDESEPYIIDHIKKMIAKGIWTPETPIQAIENKKVIDSGVISDFFNL